MTSVMKGCVMALLLVTGAAQAGHSPQEARNKQNVLEFYRQGLNNKDFAAARPFLGEQYKQHNPNAKDGVAGFRRFVELLKTRYPNSHSEVKQAFVDGDDRRYLPSRQRRKNRRALGRDAAGAGEDRQRQQHVLRHKKTPAGRGFCF